MKPIVKTYTFTVLDGKTAGGVMTKETCIKIIDLINTGNTEQAKTWLKGNVLSFSEMEKLDDDLEYKKAEVLSEARQFLDANDKGTAIAALRQYAELLEA